jgi:DNA (cytosine-5)-methyltransferase 1
VAWHPLGWEAAAFSEIEKFPRQVLAHHYPNVPLHGDFTTIKGNEYGPVELLVGGTPCQSFSVAGLRKGLSDPRGNLMLEYGALAQRLGSKWLVWENVPGVLSANGGRDFGTFIGMLAELGYGFAYRVLDAQYFGVAQRRRRVFVVGCLGDWRSAAAVLFEQHSLQGHPAPRRKAGQIAPTIPARSTGGGGLGTDFDCDGGTICVATGQAGAEIGADMAPTLNCNHEAPYIAHTLRGEGFDASDDGTGSGTPLVAVPHVDTMPTLRAGAGNGGAGHGARSGDSKDEYIVPVLPFDTTQITSKANGSNPQQGDPCHPLARGAHVPAIVYGTQDPCVSDIAFAQGRNNGAENALVQHMQVRRLTPTECERLQGFPDGYTDINPNGKPTADGPRYKALGNSMAVPVMRWIGQRIQAVEDIHAAQKMGIAA